MRELMLGEGWVDFVEKVAWVSILSLGFFERVVVLVNVIVMFRERSLLSELISLDELFLAGDVLLFVPKAV